MVKPPRLRAGSRVMLVAPAGPIDQERVDIAHDRCRRLGLVPVAGRSILQRRGFLAGADEERLADLRAAFAAPDAAAVWALRGGYGTMRLLNDLDLSVVQSQPRAYIGFSDNTAIHLALLRRGIVSFHGPHAGGDATDLAERELQRVLWSPAAAGALELPAGENARVLQPGRAEGALVGGNLSLLAALCGTPGQPTARDRILFIEEVGEPAYRVDRMLMQLRLAGACDGVQGLALGRFTDCGPGTDEVLAEFAAVLGVPALADLPIGHEADNWTLPLGVRARLATDAGSLELLEGAVV